MEMRNERENAAQSVPGRFSAAKYLEAQSGSYERALAEIRQGRKYSHWIWYIFPQIAGLGSSRNSEYYAIRDLEEAKQYLQNDLLRARLVEISEALLEQDGDIREIMDYPDHLKVRSCMTLFKEADPGAEVFSKVLAKFYGGLPDERTLSILYGGEQIGRKPSRHEMVEVFRDTMMMISSTGTLLSAVEESKKGTKLYMPEDALSLPENPGYPPVIRVSSGRSLETAGKLARQFPGERVALLNFASATSPGGGVLEGARAQEESICRCSTLYPCLTQPVLLERYYRFHRMRNDCRYTDACIYTPDVVAVKTDERIPERMPEEEWFKTDIITCAAPNLRHSPDLLSPEEQYRIHLRRADRILSVAAASGATILVLGAFGCGAFHNIPEMVAKAYRDALAAREGYFKQVEFAIFNVGGESANYAAFASVFADGADGADG